METEVEIKYETTNPKLVEKFLCDGEVKSTKKSMDVYYDTEDFSLFKRGIFVRVRDNKKLDFKYNFEDDKHEYCQENSFELSLHKEKVDNLNKVLKVLDLKPTNNEVSLNALLELNNLKEFVIIEKTRTKISKENLNFCLDNIKGLGEFIEIEGFPKQQSEIKEMIAKIEEIAKKLNLKKITTGYVELHLRKYNYELYKQGKFLLSEGHV